MKVLRNTSLYMAAGLLPNFVNLILLPLYTRFLDPGDYGLVSLITTLMSFLATIAGLQLANTTERLYFDYEGQRLKPYVSTVLFALLVINGLLMLGYHLAGQRLTRGLFPRVEIAYFPHVLLGLTGLFFMTIVNFCKGLFRVQERAGLFLAGSISFVIAGAGLGVYFVVVRRMGAEGVLLATAANAALHAVLLLVYIRSCLVFRFDFRILRAALCYSLPLIPHVMGGVLFAYTDKYILSFYAPLAAIGIYDLACRLANVMRMIIISYHAAMTPDFIRSSLVNREETLQRYASTITRWAVLLCGMFLGFSLFAEAIIRVLAPPAYHAAYRLVPILAAGFVFRGLQGFPIAALMVEKRTKVFPLITLVAGVMNVLLNLLLIPRYGVPAAAWTTLLAYATAFLLAMVFARRYHALHFEWRKLAFVSGLTLALLGIGLAAPVRGFWPSQALKMVLMLCFAGVVLGRNIGGLAGVLRALLRAAQVYWRAGRS